MDKLALDEAGIRNVISVPDGAPRAVKEGDLPPPEADTKFQYLWNCRAVLDQAVRIVLATDSDAPGQVPPLPDPRSALRPCFPARAGLQRSCTTVKRACPPAKACRRHCHCLPSPALKRLNLREIVMHVQALAEELARRLGRDRCWRVRWPSEPSSTPPDAGDQGAASVARKDANEVLLKDGPEPLQALIRGADPYPIRGLFKCVAHPRATLPILCFLCSNSQVVYSSQT